MHEPDPILGSRHLNEVDTASRLIHELLAELCSEIPEDVTHGRMPFSGRPVAAFALSEAL